MVPNDLGSMALNSTIRLSVVSIVSERGNIVGAGFFISQRIAITCAHVIQLARSRSAPGGSVIVELYDGTRLRTNVSDVFWASPDKEDVAVLDFSEDLNSSIKPLKLGSPKNTENQQFDTYGFPKGHPGGLWGRGFINNDVIRPDGIILKQLTSQEVTNGFSGSPVFNQKSRCVVGMITERTRPDLEQIDKKTKVLSLTGRLTETAFATPSSVLVRIFPEVNFEHVCPYLDLAAFTAKDAGFFYGRDKLVEILVRRIRAYPNFLAVIGASGSGKSSVVQAKILPKIQRGEVLGFDSGTAIISFRPSQSRNLETSFFSAFEAAKLTSDFVSLEWNSIETCLQKSSQKSSRRIVVFIDQFEEIFSPQYHAKESHNFLEKMSNLLDRVPVLTIILTMRTEFDPLLESSPFGKYLANGSELIRGVAGEHLNLEEVIVQPAESVNLRVEASLVTAIVRDLNDTESPLPLLEFTLTELWKRNNIDNFLTYETYENIGRVTGALRQWADNFYRYEFSQQLNSFVPRDESQKTLLRRILARLIWFGVKDVPDVRRKVLLESIKGLGENVGSLINQMTDARLLVTNEDTVELVHDSLINEWLKQKELAEWVEEQRQFIVWRQRFEQEVQEWKEDSNKLLYRPYLNTAVRWLETHGDDLNHVEKEYIRQSQKYENRRQRCLITSLCVGMTILFFTSITAIFQWQRAVNREKTAQSIQMATIAESTLATDTTESLTLALRAFQIKKTPEANLALGKAFYANHESAFFDHSSQVTYGEYALDRSGKFLTVSRNGLLRVWASSESKTPLCIVGKESPSVKHARFNPHLGNQVLTVNNDFTISLWDVEKCQTVQNIEGHSAPINYAAYDPNNPSLVVTASSDGTAKIWDVNAPKEPIRIFENSAKEVWKAEFYSSNTSNSSRILIVSADGKAKVWNLDTEEIISVEDREGRIMDANFDPRDPNRIITVSNAKTAKIWNLDDLDKPVILEGHESSVVLGIISPDDSNQAITLSKDGFVKIWNINKPEESNILLEKISKASYVTYNPSDKDQLLITGFDGAVGRAEIWSVSKLVVEKELIGHRKSITHAMFSPREDNHILTISNDTTARIWDVGSKSIFRTVRSEQGIVVMAKFVDENQNLLALLNKDGLIEYWNISSGKLVQSSKLNVARDSIVNGDFNPHNNRKIATVNIQGDINIWNLDSPQKKIRIPLRNDSANRVLYNPTNPDQIMIITRNGVVTVHSVSESSKEPIMLSKLPSPIIFGQFSLHNSDEVITTSQDGAISIWSLRTPSSPRIEKRHDSDVFWFASYHPTNQNIILSGGEDRRAKIWDLSQDTDPIELEGHTGIITSGSMASQEDNLVATSAQDGLVNIWDLEYSNEPLSIQELEEEVLHTAFNLEKTGQLLTLSNLGVLRIYNTSGQNLFEQAANTLSRCFDFDTINGELDACRGTSIEKIEK